MIVDQKSIHYKQRHQPSQQVITTVLCLQYNIFSQDGWNV